MDESRLRELVESFYERVLTAWQSLPPPRPTLRDREFWTGHFVECAREVAASAEGNDARILRRIHQIASQQYELLTTSDKMLGAGRVLRDVADTAATALRTAGANGK